MLLLNLIQVTESISGSVVPLAMFIRGKWKEGGKKIGFYLLKHKLLFFTAQDVAIASPPPSINKIPPKSRLIDHEHCCPECFCCFLQYMIAAKVELQKSKSLLADRVHFPYFSKINSWVCIQSSFDHLIQIYQKGNVYALHQFSVLEIKVPCHTQLSLLRRQPFIKFCQSVSLENLFSVSQFVEEQLWKRNRMWVSDKKSWHDIWHLTNKKGKAKARAVLLFGKLFVPL